MSATLRNLTSTVIRLITDEGVIVWEPAVDLTGSAVVVDDIVRFHPSIVDAIARGKMSVVGTDSIGVDDLAEVLAGGTSFNYTGASSSASHVVNHGLGFYPNVSCFLLATGQEIKGLVIHHSTVQAEIQFNTAEAIMARLS